MSRLKVSKSIWVISTTTRVGKVRVSTRFLVIQKLSKGGHQTWLYFSLLGRRPYLEDKIVGFALKSRNLVGSVFTDGQGLSNALQR